jgi:hypothetical protein
MHLASSFLLIGGPPRLTAADERYFNVYTYIVSVNAMIKNHTEYHDLGELYYEQRYQGRTIRRLHRQVTEPGFQLVPLEPSFAPLPRVT